MGKRSDEKNERFRAIQRETERREEAARRDCPLSREELDGLLDALAERIMNEGHDRKRSWTRAWLLERGKDPAPTLAYFAARGMSTDLDIALGVDTHAIFGPANGRLARMPLELDDLLTLMEWLNAQCLAHGCDDSRRHTRRWLAEHGHPVATTELALLTQGAGCDCEVLLNVDPAVYYEDAPDEAW